MDRYDHRNTPAVGWVILALIVALGLAATCAHAGTATVSWTAPTQNTDGSPLTNLAGYRIYYGTSATAINTVVDIPVATTTQRILTLPAGMHYFQMTAYNTLGVESARTAVLSKDIPPPVPGEPGNVTITVAMGMLQAPVYSVTASNARSVYMGAIDPGKRCGDVPLFTYRSRTFYEVQRADVILWGSTSLRLAAPCA